MSFGAFIPPSPASPHAYLDDARPLRIRLGPPGEPSVVEFSDRSAPSVCLRCPDVPCARYSADERDADVVIDLTRDPSAAVCAFEAIEVDAANGTPVIRADACGACGLCVERCPVGAIAWSDAGAAVVQIDPDRISEIAEDVERHWLARKRGLAARERRELADTDWGVLRRRFDKAVGDVDPTHLRLLVRNLLRGLGIAAHSGIRGDTSDRTEIAFADGAIVGLAEIERHRDLLEGVRRVMTAVAVAHSRRGIPRERLWPVVFMLRMPNQRTDGYELVRDLAEVLDLEVAILPVAALQVAVVGSRAEHFHALVDAGRYVDRDARALDLGPAVAEALNVPLEATASSVAFSPPK